MKIKINEKIKYLLGLIISVLLIVFLSFFKKDIYIFEACDTLSVNASQSKLNESYDIYKAYLLLSEEEKEKSLINPFEFKINTYNQPDTVEDITFPTKYDLRDYIEIEVENQGQHGTCYAYSALSSLETWIAKSKGELVDFSEVHAAIYSSGAGGQFADIKNYFESGSGPIWEVDCDKEHFGDNLIDADYNMINKYLEEDIEYDEAQVKHMKELFNANSVIEKIETKSIIFPTRDQIKEHIMTYGAAVAYYYNDSEYMALYNKNIVYNYSDGFSNFPNHAVCIIGWDDNFSKNNFPTQIRPENNGAFLVLNSWGEEWGNDSGCFWVSYEDTWLGQHIIEGVTNVEYINEETKLVETIIKDADTGENIEKINNITNLVKNGTKIEINLDLRRVDNNVLVNASELTAVARNPIEGINQKLTLLSKDGYIVIPIDTKTYNVGSHYIIDVKYGDKIISKSIKIVENLYDYEIKEDNTIILTKYNGNEKNVIIPKEYVGLKVTEIDKNIFDEDVVEKVSVYCNIDTKKILETVHNYTLKITHADYKSTVIFPTCTEDGYTANVCTECNDSKDILYTELLKARGHSWGEWIIDKPATVKENGHKYRICTKCNVEKEEQIIDKITKEEMESLVELKTKEKDGKKYLQLKTSISIRNLLKRIDISEELEVADKNGNLLKETEYVGTGAKVIKKETKEEVYNLTVFGDLMGDGKTSIAELAVASKMAVNLSMEISETQFMAIDISGDDKITVVDLAAISRIMINQEF